MSEWIKTKDRLPEGHNDTLLVVIKNETHENIVDTDCYDNGFLFWTEFVTHWMPLPKPPKEKQ